MRQKRGTFECAYDYRDERGELLYQVVRYRDPKSFSQRHPDGRGWIENLAGVRRVLYGLPELAKAQAVFIVEGEKDCHSIARLGLVATCNSGGAGKWREEYAPHFAGKRVAILPDNDVPGRRHALQVAESLLSFAASVRIVEIPAGKDVTEWLVHGGDKQQLLELARAAEVLTSTELAAIRSKWVPSIQVESEAEPAPATPCAPSLVWHGLPARFVELLGRSTEAPREYRLAAFLTMAGALVGRRAWVTYSRPTFANLFTLLVGQTASSRKTTVMSFALDLMRDVTERTTAKVKPLFGLASVEGLAAAMKDGDSPEAYRVVVVEDELKSLLRKSQQKAVGNLIPRLTELYNCGRAFEVNTKNERAIITDPFVSVVSGSTPAWFSESIGESEISGGFLNRWTMFTGTPEKLIPFPSAPDSHQWAVLVNDLAEAVQEASGEYTLTSEARDVFSDFYRTFHRRKDDGLRVEATARTHLHAIKFGLLYTILDRHRQVEVEDIGRGITLATYCMETAMSMVGEAGMSWIGAQERKVLAALKAGRMSAREIMRKFSMSADDLNRISRALEKVGLVDITTETTSAGHRRVFLEAV